MERLLCGAYVRLCSRCFVRPPLRSPAVASACRRLPTSLRRANVFILDREGPPPGLGDDERLVTLVGTEEQVHPSPRPTLRCLAPAPPCPCTPLRAPLPASRVATCPASFHARFEPPLVPLCSPTRPAAATRGSEPCHCFGVPSHPRAHRPHLVLGPTAPLVSGSDHRSRIAMPPSVPPPRATYLRYLGPASRSRGCRRLQGARATETEAHPSLLAHVSQAVQRSPTPASSFLLPIRSPNQSAHHQLTGFRCAAARDASRSHPPGLHGRYRPAPT